MDCYAYALLAAGHVDLVIEAGLHAYDICAPIAVIEAAGGVVTDWEGGPVPWRRARAGRIERRAARRGAGASGGHAAA
jgi:fructose-1,6-bisphosphatase/inositol monophosphatase family enzyme